jgi:PQQ-like domain
VDRGPVAAIRHIACPRERRSDWFATAEFEHRVDVWSFCERRLVSSFATVLEFGGDRLAFQGDDSPTVLAGAYHRDGICAYDARTGDQRWQRKDLNRIQQVQPLAGDRIAVSRDERPLHVLKRETGETLAEIRGAVGCYGPADREVALLELGRRGPKSIVLYDLVTLDRLWKTSLSSFAVLDAAFGPDALAVSEAGGPVRCLDYDGIEQWRWSPPLGEHFLRLTWSEGLARFCGVLLEYESRGSQALVTFGEQGEIESAIEIAAATEHAFLAGGDLLVVAPLDDAKTSAAGEVLAVPTAELVWRFRESVPLARGDSAVS